MGWANLVDVASSKAGICALAEYETSLHIQSISHVIQNVSLCVSRGEFSDPKVSFVSLSVYFASYIITLRGCSILPEVIIPSESHPGSRLLSAAA